MFAVFSPSSQSTITARSAQILFFSCLFALLLTAHLRHAGVLWGEEDLPLAVAMQMKRGAVIYRDAWFDKPPLVPAVYLLWGAAIGPVLRLAGTVYAMLSCIVVYLIAETLWSRREGYFAAALLGFFLTFDTHAAVLPLAADLLLLLPHVTAIYFALRRQAFLSGIAAGVGFMFNAKAALVLMACAIFAWPAAIPLVLGFCVPNLIVLTWLFADGALPFYVDQVWRWPALYAGSPVVADPIRNGFVRTLNWLGFHIVLVAGAVVFWIRERRWQFMVWPLLCYAGIVLGWRFFPRYFLLLLPALTICAARGLILLGSTARDRRWALLGLLTLVVPLIRFAPRYVSLAGWTDLALEEDGRHAASIALSHSTRKSTLYVWGYRPEIYIFSRLRPATRYLECQAMTGVPADRHLTQSGVVMNEGTHEAREELAQSTPDIVVDGLSLFNPALAVQRYPELKGWLGQYHEVGRTWGTIVYVRNSL